MSSLYLASAYNFMNQRRGLFLKRGFMIKTTFAMTW